MVVDCSRPYQDEARRWVEAAWPRRRRRRPGPARLVHARLCRGCRRPQHALEAADRGLALGRRRRPRGPGPGPFIHGVIHEQAGNHGRAATAYGEAAGLLLVRADQLGRVGARRRARQRLLTARRGTRERGCRGFRLVDEGGYAVGRATVACQCGYAALRRPAPPRRVPGFRRGMAEARAIGVVRLELGAAAGLAAVPRWTAARGRAVRLLGCGRGSTNRCRTRAIALGSTRGAPLNGDAPRSVTRRLCRAWAEGWRCPGTRWVREVEAPPS
jgi:hypothetical protein